MSRVSGSRQAQALMKPGAYRPQPKLAIVEIPACDPVQHWILASGWSKSKPKMTLIRKVVVSG